MPRPETAQPLCLTRSSEGRPRGSGIIRILTVNNRKAVMASSGNPSGHQAPIHSFARITNRMGRGAMRRERSDMHPRQARAPS